MHGETSVPPSFSATDRYSSAGRLTFRCDGCGHCRLPYWSRPRGRVAVHRPQRSEPAASRAGRTHYVRRDCRTAGGSRHRLLDLSAARSTRGGPTVGGLPGDRRGRQRCEPRDLAASRSHRHRWRRPLCRRWHRRSAPIAKGTTRLYLAGDDGEVASLFTGSPLDAIRLTGAPPAASALKMTYAAWTRTRVALLVSIRRTAASLGVEEGKRVGDKPTRPRPSVALGSSAKRRQGLAVVLRAGRDRQDLRGRW